jgi:Copper amine oxidase N-terminal domain
MLSSIPRRLSTLAAGAALITTLAAPAAAAGPVTIQVNGNTLNLNPAPTERAGRVFVPLRGVFENLGASVVYASGVINASGRGHNVSLRIGSQQATVDGQQQSLDVAPFIIGASTYVPLRFVSQALGAAVNYDGTNRIVAISTNGNTAVNPPSETITPVPSVNANGNGGTITLASVQPARGASVSSRRPLIEATFGGGTVNPNTVHVYLDDLDVTNDSTRSPRGISYAPRSPLQPGQHTVRVTGTDSNGGSFSRAWRFTSGTSTASAGQISNVNPGNGATVPNQFTISGHTSPGARVTITIGAASGSTSTIGGLIGAILGGGGNQGNTASYTVSADGNGNFSQGVSVNAPSGTRLAIAINAIDPNTGASGIPVQEQVSIQ